MPLTFNDLITSDVATDNDSLLGTFLDYIDQSGLQLYPTQESAILELYEEKNVILNTPTGSGKSLVAAALHFKSTAQKKRSVYTCPIKALVNEKWLALCKEFGPDNVGLSTGDATVNRNAPILCCTAEILANIALREGDQAEVHDVIMDEFHYYSDRDRGGAWQIPLLTLPQTRFLLMSATLGETEFFEKEMTQLNKRPSVTVSSKERPVPLEHSYVETSLAQTLEQLVEENKVPIYVVHFTQLEAAQSAQDFTSINVCTKEEKAQIAKELQGFKFTSPYGPEIRRWLKHGIGLHHAGLLPKYRVLIEQLAQKGLLKVICGTDTLGVGINVPIRTVLFTKLCKYDGQKTGILTARDFHQIGGRAGRKGFDDKGWVVAQAPEHVIENIKIEQKAAKTGKKKPKRKPPERNFVPWDEKTYKRLISAAPERLSSQFNVSHGMLLNVLSREGDACNAMRDIIRRSHESPKEKARHIKRAWQLFRSLLPPRIIEFTPRDAKGTYLRVNLELQEDFSMNQTLSLYLLETIPHLDPESPEYALDVITLVEAILENPDIVLRKQLDRIKTQKMTEMKQQGMEYDERMEELEKLEYPKPKSDFVYETFNAFAARHPWAGSENIRPKSIVREMFEDYRSFPDYIKLYELQRVEGVLLRHLSNVHKVLAQTFPDTAKTEPLQEMELFLKTMIRQVDSSLLDEWERMKDPSYQATRDEKDVRPPGAEEADKDITRNTREFTAAIRTSIFNFLRGLVNQDYPEALDALSSPSKPDGTDWSPDGVGEAIRPFYEQYRYFRLDPEARNLRHTHIKISEDKQTWRIQQSLVDPEGHNEHFVEFLVNIAESRSSGEPVLTLSAIQ